MLRAFESNSFRECDLLGQNRKKTAADFQFLSDGSCFIFWRVGK